ncbi:MAG TPA: hypothetical protein VN757_12135 [Steroidobacteraceae bacterium]|nr:hypothetical protein [Steroidobacteraceae bacterium]
MESLAAQLEQLEQRRALVPAFDDYTQRRNHPAMTRREPRAQNEGRQT